MGPSFALSNHCLIIVHISYMCILSNQFVSLPTIAPGLRLSPRERKFKNERSKGSSGGSSALMDSGHNRKCRYVAVAAGAFHTVLIRSDGSAVGSSQIRIPRLPTRTTYIAVAASLEQTLFLRSDGNVVSCNDTECETYACTSFSLPGMMYTAIASGGHHVILLRSDGEAVAFGHNGDGRCDVPPPPVGTWYTAIGAGLRHSLLLRNDGKAVAFGENHLPPGCKSFGGPCDVPVLLPGYVYCVSMERSIDESIETTRHRSKRGDKDDKDKVSTDYSLRAKNKRDGMKEKSSDCKSQQSQSCGRGELSLPSQPFVPFSCSAKVLCCSTFKQPFFFCSLFLCKVHKRNETINFSCCSFWCHVLHSGLGIGC